MELVIAIVSMSLSIVGAIATVYLLSLIVFTRQDAGNQFASPPLPMEPHSPMMQKRAKLILADLPNGWKFENNELIDPKGNRRAWAYDGDLIFLAHFAERYRREAGKSPL